MPRVKALGLRLLLLGCATACASESTARSTLPVDLVLRREVGTSSIIGTVDDAIWVGDSLLVLLSNGGRQLLLSRHTGDSLRAIAVAGTGPCEIAGATSLLALSDSTFAVADAQTLRIQTRSVSGCLNEISTNDARPSQLFLTSGGTLLRARRSGSSSIELVRVHQNTLSVVTVLPSTGDVARTTCVYCRLEVLWDGSVYATSGADSVYRILHFSRDGTLLQTIERKGVALSRVLPRDADSIASIREKMLAGPMSAAARRGLQQAIREAPLQEFRPLFQRGPLVDQAADVLIAARWPESGNALPVDVFSLSSSEYLGEMLLPEGSLLLRSMKKGILGMRTVRDSILEFSVYQVRTK